VLRKNWYCRAFDPFRDRIVVVSLDEDFVSQYPDGLRDRIKLIGKQILPSYDDAQARVVFEERPYWYAERRQRDAALEVILEISGGEGWVLVSDADEFVDCSTPRRRDLIIRALRSGAGVTRLRRQRFNYDIDNFCPAVRFVGCAALRYLQQQRVGLQSIRLSNDGLLPTVEPLVFEYSYCLPRADVDRKLATYIHVDPGVAAVNVALECNHGFLPTAPNRIDYEMWYQKVDLEAVEAPEYVVDHQQQFRTGNVNPEYAEARRRRYPDLFGWPRSG